MKRTAISGMLCLFVVLTMAACRSRQPLPEKPTPTAAPFAAGIGAAEQVVAEGRVVPLKSVELSFSMGGVVTRVPAALGQQVEAGQLLAELDTRQLELQLAQAEASLASAQARLDQASRRPSEADLAAARQNLASAQAAHDTLQAGASSSEVAAAQAALAAAQQDYAAVRAGPTRDQLAQLETQLMNARAALDQAQAAYDRVKGDPDIGMLPQSVQLQQATNNYNAAVAAYDEARTHPTTAELAAAASRVQQAQAALDSLTPDAAQLEQALAAVHNAEAQLARLQPSEDERAVLEAGVEVARAAHELAAEQLQNTRLVAPFAGTVMTLDIAGGEYAAPGAPVLRLADTSAWQVETTDLTELNIVQVAEGSPATITFDAIPGLELPGHVTSIAPYGESKQGDITYTAVVRPDEQDSRLRWNMTAKVSIESR